MCKGISQVGNAFVIMLTWEKVKKQIIVQYDFNEVKYVFKY